MEKLSLWSSWAKSKVCQIHYERHHIWMHESIRSLCIVGETFTKIRYIYTRKTFLSAWEWMNKQRKRISRERDSKRDRKREIWMEKESERVKKKWWEKRRDFLKYILKRAINNNMVILSMPMGFLYFIGPVCIWFWFENERKKKISSEKDKNGNVEEKWLLWK